MGRINLGRVFIGGIAAGVVGNLFDYVIQKFLMKTEGEAMIQRLGLSQSMIEGSTTTWIIVDFLWGILLVFTYAAMRPRFGPGPKTALVAGGTLFIAVCMVIAGFTAMGMFTEQAFIKNSALQLVSTMCAALVGAALYKE